MEAHQFIEKEFFLSLPTADNFTDCQLYGCYYDVSAFNSSLYTTLEIEAPENFNQMVKKRQAEYLAGRHCAQKALEKLGIKKFNLRKDKSRNPLWPTSIKGSISHSSNVALAIVTSSDEVLGVGIDIEHIVKADKAADLLKQILYTDIEKELYQKSSDPAFIFTLLFSLKESFFKAAYPTVEKIFNFDAIEVTRIDQGAQVCEFTVKQTLHHSLKQGTKYKGYYQKLNNSLVTLCTI